jgi:hypothetical protein
MFLLWAIAGGERCTGYFGYHGSHCTASSHKVGSLSMQGSKEFFARSVKKRDTRQVHANYRPTVFRHCLLPAVLQLLHPRPRQLPF